MSCEERLPFCPMDGSRGMGPCVRMRSQGRQRECSRAAPSPRPAVARVLRHVAVLGLFADVVLLVIAMALGGVERNIGRAAGALVALVVLGNRRNGFRHQ